MSDMIFKGATRPPMILGVPMIPFTLVSGTTMILTMWTFSKVSPLLGGFILLIGFIVILWMRQISKDDDQKVTQALMRLRGIRYRANSAYWNGHSVSPIDYKRR